MRCVDLTVGGFMTNTYVLHDNGGAIVIDPGAEFERIKRVVDELAPKEVCVLITHAHFDHIGAAAMFRLAGAKIYISKTDFELLERNNFHLKLGLGDEPVQPFKADRLLAGGDKFTLFGHSVEVLATPGHTPGGVCYVLDGNCIYTGDTLFRLSIGRTDLPFCDPDAMCDSLRKLAAVPGDLAVFPGHGPLTTLDFERKNNRYLR